MQRVRLESDPTGWARLWDLTRQFDKARAEDVRDDIDTLLVFVSHIASIGNSCPYLQQGWSILRNNSCSIC